MGAGDLTGSGEGPPVAVDVVFERFPASVRGAVVVRGRDEEPHQVRMARAEVREVDLAGRPVTDVGVEPVVVDVAPRGDVVIPFDVTFSALGPGWYVIAAEVVVDGASVIPGPEPPGKRFVVPWPAAELRRGELRPDLRIDLPGGAEVTIERVQCRPDRALVRWRHPSGEEAEGARLRVLADGRRLPVLDTASHPEGGGRTTTTYPILRTHRALVFEVRHDGVRARSSPFELG